MSRPIQPQLNVQPPRARGKARVAGVVAAALVISWGAPAANAYWQTLNSGALGATADSILAMAAPTASASAGAAIVGWAQGSTAAGRPVSGYTVARYSSESGGIKVDAGGACAGTVTTLTCSEAALPSGTWYYTVTPLLAAWAGTESARSGGVTAADTTAPDAPTITAPAMIASATEAASVSVGGIAEAGSSVTITVTDGGAVHTTSQTVVAGSSGEWSAIFNLATFNDPTIFYSAVAKDAAGNVSLVAGTATSNKDTTAPAVSSITLVNGGSNNNIGPGDRVVFKFSEALDPSTICSNWSPTGGSQAVDGSEQVTVNVSTDEILSVSTTSAGCGTARIGSVALDANYVGTAALSFHGTGISGSAVSSLAWNASTFELTITLGSSRAGTPNSETKPGNHRYTPAEGLKDIVGHPLPTTTLTGAHSKF